MHSKIKPYTQGFASPTSHLAQASKQRYFFLWANFCFLSVCHVHHFFRNHVGDKQNVTHTHLQINSFNSKKEIYLWLSDYYYLYLYQTSIIFCIGVRQANFGFIHAEYCCEWQIGIIRTAVADIRTWYVPARRYLTLNCAFSSFI